MFALDADGVSEGREAPPLDPGLVVAILLVVLGVVGFGFSLAGGVLPRTLPDAGRPALIGASLAGLALGVAALVLGGALMNPIGILLSVAPVATGGGGIGVAVKACQA